MEPIDHHRQRDKNEGIWYRNDTAPDNHREPAMITRVVEDIVPSWGEYFKVYPSFDDNSENRTFKTEGLLKFDSANPIWNFTDEEISEAVKEKATERYTFAEPQDIEVDINRGDKTILYRAKKKTISFYIKSDVGKGGDEETIVNFEFLDVGETFSIDPAVMKDKYSDVWETWNLMRKGILQDVTRDDKWKKTSPYTFCLYDDKGKLTTSCLKTEFGFDALRQGAKFNLNIDKIKEKNSKLFKDMVKIINENEPNRRQLDIENSLDNTTTFIKVDENTFALGTNTDIRFDVSDPLALPVFFKVWQVLVEEKAIPENTIPLSDIGVGETFVIPDAYIPKLWRKKIIPMNSQFIKLSDDTFIHYKPGKTVLDEEEIEKFKTKKRQEVYNIADSSLPDYDTDWDRRIISPNIRVKPETGEVEKPKKKETIDGVFDSMFKQYEVKKSELGEYIVVNMEAIAKAMGESPTTDFQEFIDNTDTKTKDWENPETEETEEVKFGNSERFVWMIRELKDGKTEVVVTKV